MNILAITPWYEIYKNWLRSFGLSSDDFSFIFNGSILVITIVASVLFYFSVSKLIYFLLNVISKRKNVNLINSLNDHKFFTLIGFYAPLTVFHYNLDIMLQHTSILDKIYQICHILLASLVINSLLNTFVEVNQYKKKNHSKPIKGLVQFIQILLFFFAAVFIISALVGQNPTKLLTGLGAASAILMLIFKDSITGLVAGVQLSFNKMIEIGDWISMAKYDIDGKVIDITITTVKVRNWDETVSTIPTYSMVSTDSVRNWKGMVQGDARRMLRSIFIDLFSIRFCTSEMLSRFMSIPGVKEALKSMPELNGNTPADNLNLSNESSLTNVGVFRAYAYHYLKNHKNINQKMDLLVRQQQPSNFGLPIQIYCFTNTSKWALYENIQSDILDHLLAILPQFDLSVFQSPKDYKTLEMIELERVRDNK